MAARPRVFWAGDAEGNAKFDIDDTWDDVRRYINDNCFGDGNKPGTTRIHVRPRFRAHF